MGKTNNKLAVDVSGNKTGTIGAKVHLWDKHGKGAQQFKMNKDGSITTVYGGMALVPKGGKVFKGVVLVLGKKADALKFTKVWSDHLCLKDKTWLCMDVK